MEGKDGFVEYNLFVARHKIQLERSSVPEKFWFALHEKMKKGIFDAGDTFSLFRIEYEGEQHDTDPLYTVVVRKKEGISCGDGHEIYLVDHAWTYAFNQAFIDLSRFPGLLTRMCNLMGINDEVPSDKVKKVFSEMWRYNQTYSFGFGDAENRVPLWYIMDEFGSAIQHSEDPNFRAVPFYYTGDQMSYTIIFPIKDLECNETVTRNYLEGCLGSDEAVNQALLIPWKPCSLIHVDYTQNEPDEDYFLHGHVAEILPENDDDDVYLEHAGPMKVYSEYSVLFENLTHPDFEVVTNEDEADILWLNEHFKKYKDLKENHPDKYINQFPYEHVITVKDLLSVVCRRKKKDGTAAFTDNPPWCPTTYNLTTELPKFVSYYQSREKNNLDNHWICKPWNLARGLDIVVTDNLCCIVRLPSTGPKIAQKYVENPVLFDRPEIGLVKFDVRYVVLLKSVKPLKLYAYKNFFLRFANKTYDMYDLWDAEKHFTVMNYNPNANLYKMLCSDFIPEFNRQNPNDDWNEVEKTIFRTLREVLEAAMMKPPPCGMAHYSKSRAMYAVDLILSREENGSIQPKILEFNWNPDCKRACEYYPNFFNDVFLLLFKNKENYALFQKL